MPSRRKVAAGNWKMNGVRASLAELDALRSAVPTPACDVVLCPPATLISAMAARASGSAIQVGGQDCHWNDTGAHTGDVSAPMLGDAGAEFVIVGHSERRADHRETDAIVAMKAQAAWRAGLTAIICVGESETQKDAGAALDVVGQQLLGSVPDGAGAENTIIAYEPVWAIGTGRTPSPEDIADLHDFMRKSLNDRFGADTGEAIRLLYGGSVNAANAREIFSVSNVDGGLVGGASLKAESFAAIVGAAGRS